MLKNTIEAVMNAGATRAKQINTNNIIVDERVLLKCKIPRCPDYGICPVCPPNTFSTNEVEKIVARFSLAVLVQVDTLVEPEVDYFKGANILHNVILAGEKAAFISEARFATGLIGGSCHLCSSCRKGENCLLLEKARPSMEAMSIDVLTTVSLAGMPIKFPVIDKVTWTGLILLD